MHPITVGTTVAIDPTVTNGFYGYSNSGSVSFNSATPYTVYLGNFTMHNSNGFVVLNSNSFTTKQGNLGLHGFSLIRRTTDFVLINGNTNRLALEAKCPYARTPICSASTPICVFPANGTVGNFTPTCPSTSAVEGLVSNPFCLGSSVLCDTHETDALMLDINGIQGQIAVITKTS